MWNEQKLIHAVAEIARASHTSLAAPSHSTSTSSNMSSYSHDPTPGPSDVKERFGNAKSISSDQYFKRGAYAEEDEFERRVWTLATYHTIWSLMHDHRNVK